MSSANITASIDGQNEINTINTIIIIIARWMSPLIFVFSVISNLLNTYVFTRPTLKHNPCCMYFLSSCIAALVYTVINMPLRTLQSYNIDPSATSLPFCKLKSFFVYVWRALAIWFLALASIDRFLHSSPNVNVRRWSSYKVASRVIPLTFLVLHLAYSHVIIFNEILLPRRTCAIGNSLYGIFLGIWHLITYGTGPPLLMFTASLLTIRHVRHRRIAPATSHSLTGERHSSKDRHLLRMVLAQCLIVGSTTTVYAVSQLYTTLTVDQMKTSLQAARDNLFTGLAGAISAMGHNTTFFVFTLTSRMFREQLLGRRPLRM